LKADEKFYAAFYNTLKSANHWSHYLESTWLIVTELDTQAWTNKLQDAVYKGDRFLVVDITDQSRQGLLPQEAWDWIKRNEKLIRTTHG
jgi:hypothetical protein